MLPRDRVGCQRAAGVGSQQRHRYTRFHRQIIAVEEIRLGDDFAHLVLNSSVFV